MRNDLVKAVLAASKNLQTILQELPKAIKENQQRFTPEEMRKVNEFSKDVGFNEISRELDKKKNDLNELVKKYT